MQPHFIIPVRVISYEYDSWEPITEESAKKVIEQDEKIYMSTYISEYYYFNMQKVNKIRNLVIDFSQRSECNCPRDGNHCVLDTRQFDFISDKAQKKIQKNDPVMYALETERMKDDSVRYAVKTTFVGLGFILGFCALADIVTWFKKER